MANELDLYNGGGLQPYHGGEVAPAPDFGTTDVDLLREDHSHQSGNQLTFFGAPMPAGADERTVLQTLNEIQALIGGDLTRLEHPQAVINACINWFQTNARKTPARETKRHSYNLFSEAGNLVAESWANAMARAGASQKFVSDCLWLINELNKRLLGTQEQGSSPRTSGPTENVTDKLTDQQWDVLLKHNLKVQGQTMAALQRKHGDYTFQQVIDIAQKHLESLPAREQAHFDQYTGAWPWTHMMNTVEAIEFLYNAAIGSASLPTNGPDIAREIAECERCMRTNRKQWLADPQLQARYRTLLNLKG